MCMRFGEMVFVLLKAEPFVPFELWINGEMALYIANNEHVRLIDEDYGTLAAYDPEKDRTTFINMLTIEQVRIRGKRLSL